MTLRWAYGVTTVPQRRKDLLPRTLRSLANAGFSKPRLFIDGLDYSQRKLFEYYMESFRLPITIRDPNITPTGNWVLALYELWIRNPNADRYALFQDDIVVYKNLMYYLNRYQYPPNGYCNLMTYPSNHTLTQKPNFHSIYGHKVGWFESLTLNDDTTDQTGRSACGLVFDRAAITTLLTSRSVVMKWQDCHMGHRKIDGMVVTALNAVGFREYVHHPSLLEHTGDVSSLGNTPQPYTQCFRGEEFDALKLLPEVGLDPIHVRPTIKCAGD